jgi:hypothetical protein
MGLFDSRAVAGGLVGGLLLTVLRQATRTASGSPVKLLVDATAGTLYYSLAGASSRPMLTGVLLGAGAGIGSALLPGRANNQATISRMASHTLAGLTAGAVCAGLSTDLPAKDFAEAFFP